MKKFITFSFVFFIFISCQNDKKSNISSPKGMIWVEGKTFLQGAKENDKYAMPREKPAHKVYVDGFFIDTHEVTNKQFRAFVEATNYITTAEKPIDWDEIKKELKAKKETEKYFKGFVLYNPKTKEVQGAYTSKNNSADRMLGTTLVQGDNIVVEYYEPKAEQGNGALNISMVVHGYRSLGAYPREKAIKGLHDFFEKGKKSFQE